MCSAPHKRETPEFVRGESPPRTDPRGGDGEWAVRPRASRGRRRVDSADTANPAAAQIRRTDSGVQWSGALPPPAANVARRKAGGSRGAQHPPCQSAMFNIAWAGLGPVKGPEPALRTPPKRLSGHRPERSAHRITRTLPGLSAAPLMGWRKPQAPRHSFFDARLALCDADFHPTRTPRGPVIVDPGRSYDP